MYSLAFCCAGLFTSSRQNRYGWGELIATSRSSLSGCAIATPQATAPPQSCATSTNFPFA